MPINAMSGEDPETSLSPRTLVVQPRSGPKMPETTELTAAAKSGDGTMTSMGIKWRAAASIARTGASSSTERSRSSSTGS